MPVSTQGPGRGKPRSKTVSVLNSVNAEPMQNVMLLNLQEEEAAKKAAEEQAATR